MSVEDSSKGFEVNKLRWKLTFDFPGVFPQLGGDIGQAQRLVEPRLVGKFNIIGSLHEAVFIDLQALFLGELAQADVVLFAAGKVSQGGRELGVRDDAKIDLHPRRHPHAGLGIALPEDLGDSVGLEEVFHHGGGMVGAGQEVNIPHDLLPAAQAPGNAYPPNGLMGPQMLDQAPRNGEGVAEEILSRVLLQKLDALEDLLLGLFPEPFQGSEPVLRRCLPKPLDAADAQILPDDAGLLWPEVGNREHLEYAGRHVLAEVLIVVHLPGGNELADLLLQRLSDALDLAELLLLDKGSQIAGEALEGAGAILVGADFEGVFVLDLENARDRLQDLDDLRGIHGRLVAIDLVADIALRLQSLEEILALL